MSITKEREEELVKRIYYQQIELAEQRRKEHEDQLERQRKEARRVIPKSSEGALVKRVYEQQMEEKRQERANVETKKYEEIHSNDKKLDSGAMDERIRHLYDESIEQHKALEAELKARYCPEKEPKKLSKSQIQETSVRLYTDNYEEREKKLFEKYVYPNDPPVRKIPRSREAELADRMSTK